MTLWFSREWRYIVQQNEQLTKYTLRAKLLFICEGMISSLRDRQGLREFIALKPVWQESSKDLLLIQTSLSSPSYFIFSSCSLFLFLFFLSFSPILIFISVFGPHPAVIRGAYVMLRVKLSSVNARQKSYPLCYLSSHNGVFFLKDRTNSQHVELWLVHSTGAYGPPLVD